MVFGCDDDDIESLVKKLEAIKKMVAKTNYPYKMIYVYGEHYCMVCKKVVEPDHVC